MKPLVLGFLCFPALAFSYQWGKVDWSRNVQLPDNQPRSNIYNLSHEELKDVKNKGYLHALVWPVEVTGLVVPYKPLLNFLEADENNPLKKLINDMIQSQSGIESEEGLYKWLGLNKYPTPEDPSVFKVPYPGGVYPKYRMGASIIDRKEGQILTFSCATCHSGEFMGKTVMGLTNKRTKANEFFLMAKKYVPKIPLK